MLVDIGQVLASFGDAIVVVGGWVPDLLLPAPTSAHIGSIDVDLALDVAKLEDGRYAELLKLLLDTGRYDKGDKDFQLVCSVDLADGDAPVKVELEHIVERAAVLSRGRVILPEHLSFERRPASGVNLEDLLVLPFHESVEAWEKLLVQRAMDESAGSKTEAAKRLGINRRLLYEKLQRSKE